MVVGCNKPSKGNGGTETPGEVEKPKTLTEKIAGEWHCSPSNIEADIYIAFTAEGTFELYQQITEGAFRLYRGTWSVDEEKMEINGKYNDDEPWGSSYKLVMSEDINSMTFTDSASNEYVYSRTEIPAEIKENCVVMVKSPYAY